MFVIAIPILLIALTLLVKLAMHPLRFLLAVMRVLFFVFAVGAWILFFNIRAEYDHPLIEDLLIPIGFTIPWLLTFLPGRNRPRAQDPSR
ncbi:MAG: hypothetical protein ACTH0V_00525 [Microbacteriaceae bacterium]